MMTNEEISEEISNLGETMSKIRNKLETVDDDLKNFGHALYKLVVKIERWNKQ